MTKEQLNEVNEAVNEMYTLKEIYWSVANMDWTMEMFELFVKRLIREKRR
jgi:hypothetical protein